MTAEDFYEEFKVALDYLGPGFRGMRDVNVSIEADRVCLQHGVRECFIRLPSVTGDGYELNRNGKAL